MEFNLQIPIPDKLFRDMNGEERIAWFVNNCYQNYIYHRDNEYGSTYHIELALADFNKWKKRYAKYKEEELIRKLNCRVV